VRVYDGGGGDEEEIRGALEEWLGFRKGKAAEKDKPWLKTCGLQKSKRTPRSIAPNEQLLGVFQKREQKQRNASSFKQSING